MNDLCTRLADLTQLWLDRQPDLALLLAAAAAVFWLRWFTQHATPLTAERFWQQLVLRAGFALGATVLTAAALYAHAGLRGTLQAVDRHFSAHHGRVTEANRQAVQTIWGQAQRQPDLSATLSYTEEVEERVQSGELDKPDIIHTVKKTTYIHDNPFRQERHRVRLNANPRRKGSALYAGYETDCRFAWKLANPADRAVDLTLSLPLPADGAVYFDFATAFNGVDVLGQAHFSDGCLRLTRTLAAHEAFDFTVAFRSRGLETWFFQNADERELRDFDLEIDLADIPVADLNYPAECMTPTAITALNAGAGSRLRYTLDHALSPKGMGVALSHIEQPGEAVGAILSEAPRGWTLFFALLWIGLAIVGVRAGDWLILLTAAPLAFGYGLLADWTDAGLDPWLAVTAALLPWLVVTGLCLRLRLPRVHGWILTAGLTLIGLGYPLAAGLDDSRAMMYRNLAGLVFLGVVGWLAVRAHPSHAKSE